MADVPSADRPRERLTRLGSASLSDAELVALVLRNGSAGSNALDTARALLHEHGSLEGLSAALAEELSRARGLGTAKTASLVAAFELGRRVEQGANVQRVVRGPEDVAAAVRPLMGDRRREEAFVVTIGVGNRIQHVRKIAEGGRDRCYVTPREILGTVLRLDGSSFVLAHTHPSDDVSPSPADVATTAALADAASELTLTLLDHVIVGRRSSSSLRRLGLMS